MTPSLTLALLLGLTALAYHLGRRRAFTVAGGRVNRLHSLPGYYGLHAALWCALPALALFLIWISLE
ncbi:MAG TPA: phosphate ABC transporter permease family protein, partial [Plasticicumulans sp.]|nr:phosphate ABC transporter permease family protein [Plasticicumulans sp.]